MITSSQQTSETTTIYEIDCSPTTTPSIDDPAFYSGHCPFVPNNFRDIPLSVVTEGFCESCAQPTKKSNMPAPQTSPSEKKLQEEIKKMKTELQEQQQKVRDFSEMISAVTDEFTCSICHDILVGPYTLKDCGHTFCGQCLLRWLNMKKNMCPECRAKVVNKTKAMCPDFKLASAISKLVHATFSNEDKREYEERERNWRSCGGVKLLKRPAERRAKTISQPPTRSPTPTPPPTPRLGNSEITTTNNVGMPFAQEWVTDLSHYPFPYPLAFHSHLQHPLLHQPYIHP
jgi:hypothetical protein